MRAIPTALALSVAVVAVPGATRAELAAWDAEKVTALGRDLQEATENLYDTFYKQAPPTLGSGQSRAYERLKQKVRRIRSEARAFAKATQRGEGREQTAPIYEQLMLEVRDAREEARSIFTTADVAEKAAVARGLLNQLGPYYDPEFQALEPVAR